MHRKGELQAILIIRIKYLGIYNEMISWESVSPILLWSIKELKVLAILVVVVKRIMNSNCNYRLKNKLYIRTNKYLLSLHSSSLKQIQKTSHRSLRPSTSKIKKLWSVESAIQNIQHSAKNSFLTSNKISLKILLHPSLKKDHKDLFLISNYKPFILKKNE